jgi:alanyl-tRNA synthetase
MTGNEIREAFLRFFEARGHTVLPSSALVPEDPTTLFTTAGMQQFVPWFRREVAPPYGSVATVQKCARTDDLDQVGRTARHHTFFEMLGNFSFGDYFKKETLRWGWEFSTLPPAQGGLGLDPERVWVTYYQPKPGEPYQEDLEAKAIWRQIGVPEARIVPLGKKENWWGPVGDSGPCGPCSEMHYDRGAHLACGPDCTSPACGCDRWIEFWNHVFQQFNFQDGQYLPLPAPGIDTGAGLERIASLVQNVPTNFDTDLLQPIIVETVRLAGDLAQDDETAMALRVVADHLRCAAFMIADGVKPGNTGRGYVVRRIIRRAHRFGRKLGFAAPFLFELVPALAAMMGDHYGELLDNARIITSTFRAEEARFGETLERGEELLARMIAATQQRGATQLAGDDVFTLYETYGFPKELTEETALAAGLTIDEAGYLAAETAHKQASASGAAFAYRAAVVLGPDVPATAFVGYAVTETEATLLHFAAADDRGTAVVVLDKTPFYATSGGQCADYGTLTFGQTALRVIDVTKDKFGHTLHTLDLTEEEAFEPGPHHTVVARVDAARREAIRRAHTATHLLHWALHQVVGPHATQAGSLVDEDVLRFDFSQPQALTAEEITRVEDLVYAKILADAPVAIRDMSLAEARKEGYTALFGEKYGDWVRTVNIGGGEVDVAFSRELCGGTHLARTGQAGLFKIVAETSVAAGIRRVEALTGLKAQAWARGQAGLVRELSQLFKVPGDDVPARVEALQRELRDAQAQISDLKVKVAAGGGAAGPQAEEIHGTKAIIAQLDGVDAATLAQLADQYLNTLQRGVVVLASATDGKALFAVKVSKDLTGAIQAGNIVREAAKIAGGGGGGRPDFAQAGGKDASQIPAALGKARGIIAGE